MKFLSLRSAIACVVVAVSATFYVSAQNSELTSPEDFYGFTPGEDRKLVDYEQLISYLQKLDAASPMLKMENIGQSPEGRPMYIAFFSSAENIANLDRLREINRELALNPDLSKSQQQALIKDGKVFTIATLSMHSTEVGPAQAASLIAYDFLTSKDPHVTSWMSDVVYMMVPCHNPDGMDYVVKNYRKYLGTKYEGAALPRVYHKYVGHDNNRDFVILSQQDTKNINHIFTQTWFPQVMVEKHQMGSTGPRYFVPPNSDPIAENIDARLWTWTGIFGQNMINDMTRAGQAGISQHYSFDNYWPGSTETCLWQNVIALLTECASANIATPIYIEPNELNVRGKGLSEYKKSINMPMPWKGGWWRLGDIVRYEITSTRSILKTSAMYHDKILALRNNLCKREVNKGKTEAPYYYILPAKQYDVSEWVNLLNLLREQGVKIYTLNKDQNLDGRLFKAGDMVVPLAQPFRAFIKEVMEVQHYPVRHYTPGGEIIRPYDIASWCLPLHRQVRSFEINKKYSTLEGALSEVKGTVNMMQPLPLTTVVALFPVEWNESFKAAFLAKEKGMTVERLTGDVTINGKTYHSGSFVITAQKKVPLCWRALEKEIKVEPVILTDKKNLPLKQFLVPRLALVETYYSDMDAGWTRYIFDTYHIPYTVIHPDQFEKTDFVNHYDAVIFPNDSKNALLNGTSGPGNSYHMSSYAPEYSKGMGKKGLEKLMTFLDNGGHIVAWGSSTALFEGKLSIPGEKVKGKEKEKENEKENFQLPFRDISSRLQKQGLYIPGSLVKIKLIPNHPLTRGLPPEIGVFSRGHPVFMTSIPRFDMDRRVIATYPEKNILMSGYAEKEELMGNRSALIWLKKGKGQLVLFGFNPQFRASTQASYKLLFNALLLR
ncbi:MAG: hypothetical protein GXO83_06020 [Chlorobi bacterium]|nr:hypothetical protein [Chlorobiota bacterium]